MQIGWRVGIRRPAVEPALSGFDVGAAQGRALAALLLVPAPRKLAEPRMLAHPGKVGVQRRVEGCQRRVLVVALGAKHPVQPAQRRRRVGVGNAPRHHGDQPLAEPRALLELPAADARRDRIRTDRKHHGVGSRDQPAEAFFPRLAGRDVGLVEEGVEAARGERSDQHLREGQILARIGDENLGAITGLGIGSRRLLGHRPVAPANANRSISDPALSHLAAADCLARKLG